MATMTTTQQPNGKPAPKPGQMVPFKERVNDLRSFLEKGKTQLAAALPKHIKPEKVMRVILTEVSRTPKLLECTRESFWGAILQCAQLGLEPGGVLGHAYLVPFKNHKNGGKMECQLIPGYKGLVKLAYQSGEVGAIRARVVRRLDKFSYGYGLNEHLEHEPHRGSDPGDIVAVYAVARIKGVDEAQFVVLELWEIDEIRARSKSPDSGPWMTDFCEMAKKSAVRRLCKMLPSSVEKDHLARAVALDEAAESPDMNQTDIIDVTAIQEEGASEPDAPASALDKLAAEKRAAREQAPPTAQETPPREPGADDD